MDSHCFRCRRFHSGWCLKDKNDNEPADCEIEYAVFLADITVDRVEQYLAMFGNDNNDIDDDNDSWPIETG